MASRMASGDSTSRNCSDLVNNMSINFTPFSQIKFTINVDFSSGNNGVGSIGNLIFLTTSKSTLTTKSGVFWAGYGTGTVCTVDVSDINQHVFFRVVIGSNGSAGGQTSSSTVTISKIEFVK